MSQMIRRFAVIGRPVHHSLSPRVHASFARQTGIDLTYVTLEGDEQQFEQQVRDFFAAGGAGLNITLPFKQRAFAMADERTTRCAVAGAANTLWMVNDRLHADNTDGQGLIRDLTRYTELSGKSALMLGAGGAARGVIGPLLDAGLDRLYLVNRDKSKAEALRQVSRDIHPESFDTLQGKTFSLVINATSAGLTGNPMELPALLWADTPFCYDLSYNLSVDTPFVATAKRNGCHACDGLGMLVEQAAESFYIWNKQRPDTDATLRALRH